MARRRQDLAARMRGESNRDRGSRRVSAAIDAQRRLNLRRVDGTRAKAAPVGPSDPRYAYLTRSHGLQGLPVPCFECPECKTRLHSTASEADPIGDLYPVCGSLLEPVGDSGEIVGCGVNRGTRRQVA